MNVVLYYPKVTEKSLWFRIPLGYLSLGSVLAANDIKVKVIDSNYEKNPLDRIDENIIPAEKLIFGISAMTGYQIKDGLDIARYVRGKYPHALIVWGGWHPSLLPEKTLENELVDCIVMGPGEQTLLELVWAYRDNSGFSDIPGMGYKSEGRLIINDTRCELNFKDKPPLKWDLIDLESYLMHDVAPRTATYISSRGCPYRCGFCAVKTVYRRRWYPLRVENVIKEIKHLIDVYGVNGIRFEDSNFFTNKNRVIQICNQFIEEGIDIKWSALARPDDLMKYTQDELRLLKKSGLSQLLVGVESADQEALDLIKKDISADVIDDLVRLSIKEDISLILSYMVGLPTENGRDIDITLNYIKYLHSKYPFGEKNNEILLFYYTPYPGSDLYRLALQYGFKEPAALGNWTDLTLNEFHAPWITEKQDRKIQKAMQTYRIIKFYIRAAAMLKNLINTMEAKSKNVLLIPFIKIVYAVCKFRIDRKIFFFPLSRYIFYTFSNIPIFEFLKKLEGKDK